MTTMDFVLIVTVFLGLITTWWSVPKVLHVVPFLLAGLALIQIAVDGYQANMLPVYLVLLALLVTTIVRILREDRSGGQGRYGRALITALFGRLLGVLALFLAVRATLFFSLPPADLSTMTWSDAFAAAHAKLSREYAFGEWKQIDWDKLYDTYAPQIAAAESKNDRQGYYQTLLRYTSSIPDGHVWLKGDDFGSRELAVGGGYGMEILGLDDGRVIAVTVDPDGPADKAGIVWGAEILSWNGLPITEALAQTPVTWPKRRGAPATQEGLRLEQYRLIVRTSEGTEAQVTYRNPGKDVSEAVLVAVHDGKMEKDGNADLQLQAVESGKILPSGYGYIKVNSEHDDGGTDPGRTVQEAMQKFVENDVPGIILDIRGNIGGDDKLVPQYVGYFFSDRELYEKITLYSQPFNTFIGRPPQLWIDPLEPHYGGPVVALIDQACFSSGEGIAMAIGRLPQGANIGFYGTYGSFGMTGGIIYLPEDLTLFFPDGQSLDARTVIQLDSNDELEGGVPPTIRISMTEKTAHALFVDHQDVLLDFAQDYLEKSLPMSRYEGK